MTRLIVPMPDARFQMADDGSRIPDAGSQMPDPRCRMLVADEPAWLLLQSGPGEPAHNMALDEALLEHAPECGRPVLRQYSWTRPAATFGYSQRIADAERLTPLRPLVRRPTGGGVVPHDGDWTYTLVFPPGHPWYQLRARDSYARLHAWVRQALDRAGLPTDLAPTPAAGAPTHCFLRAEQFDILHHGAKIAGAAQRRTRHGLLIQGSVQPPDGVSRSAWEGELRALAAREWRVRWELATPVPAVEERAVRLASERYRQEAYNRRR
jgi:lipoate-protein ligase A